MRTIFKKPGGAQGNNTSRLSVDVPNDVLQKLEVVAQHQSTWDATKPRVEVEDVVLLALNVFLKGSITESGSIIPNVQADAKGEESPVVRMTNAILVNAIERDILDFQVPPAEASDSDGALAAHFPEHMQVWFIRRLQVMTTTKTGTIPIVHAGTPYTVNVEFDTRTDGRARVHVKLNRL